jgi:pyruvate kinase
MKLDAKFIISITKTGYNARVLSRHKPTTPVIVLTPSKTTFQQLQLSWGCYPILINEYKSIKDASILIREVLVKEKFAKKGDKVVVSTSMPFGETHELKTSHRNKNTQNKSPRVAGPQVDRLNQTFYFGYFLFL